MQISRVSINWARANKLGLRDASLRQKTLQLLLKKRKKKQKKKGRGHVSYIFTIPSKHTNFSANWEFIQITTISINLAKKIHKIR